MTADGEPPPSGARSRVRSLVLARPLLGSTLAVAAVTTIARFNGGVREVLIAREFGTAESLEAFLVAFALVSVMIDALTGAVPSSLIPTIHVRRSDGDRTAEVLGAILPPALGAALVLVVGLAVGSAPVAALIAGGFDAPARDQVRVAMVVLAPTVLFGMASSVASACLQDRARFVSAVVPSLASPIVAIGVVLVFPPSATTLAAAFCAGYAAELSVAFVLAAARGIRVARPHPTDGRSDRQLFVREFLAIAVGLLVVSSMNVTDQAVATHLDQGQVAIFAFGSRLSWFLSAVGVTAVGLVVMPQFARLAGSGEWLRLRSSMLAKARLVLVATVAGSVALFLFAGPMVELVFGHGEFTAADAEAAAAVQRFAAWQVPFQVVGVVFARVLSARHRNRSILVVAIVVAAANLVADLALAPHLGARGLALSTVIGSALACGAYLVLAVRAVTSGAEVSR